MLSHSVVPRNDAGPGRLARLERPPACAVGLPAPTSEPRVPSFGDRREEVISHIFLSLYRPASDP